MYKMSWRYRVNYVHVYLPHPKYSQDFWSVERIKGPNNELKSKYKVRPFGHVGTSCAHVPNIQWKTGNQISGCNGKSQYSQERDFTKDWYKVEEIESLFNVELLRRNSCDFNKCNRNEQFLIMIHSVQIDYFKKDYYT